MVESAMFRKVRWLLSHSEFKKHPLAVSGGVFKWEFNKLLSRRSSLTLGDIELYARPCDGNGRLICYFGTRFDELYEFLEHYLKPGMTFVDVGANIGSHTLHAARLVGRSGKVFAFEADPNTYQLLRENIERNRAHNVKARQVAVSDRSGAIDFYLTKDSAKSSTVYRDGYGKIEIECKLLDNILPGDVEVDILKIDVEGADKEVLKGAARLLSSRRAPKVIVTEILDIVDNVDHGDEIGEILSGYEYELCKFEGGELVRVGKQRALNAYFVKRAVREDLARPPVS